MMFEIYKKKNGDFHFRIKHNGEVISESTKTYIDKKQCLQVVAELLNHPPVVNDLHHLEEKKSVKPKKKK